MPLIVLTHTTRPRVVHRPYANRSTAAPYLTTSQPATRYGRLINLCRSRGCPREDAKELVQEAYLRLFQYRRSTKVRDQESLLRRIVLNLSITYYYREMSAAAMFESAHNLERCALLVDPAPSPERILAAEQELDGIVNLLSAVSTRTCQMFITQRAGYRYEEIAQAFCIAERTVEKHIATAQSLLLDAKSKLASSTGP